MASEHSGRFHPRGSGHEYVDESSGVVCLPAKESGLVPDGWNIVSDDLGAELDLSGLDFSYCPVMSGENCI